MIQPQSMCLASMAGNFLQEVKQPLCLSQVHLKKRESNLAEDITEKNLRELAFDTQRYSGAAIANLVNLAAMRVERDGRDMICYKDLTDVRIWVMVVLPD